MFTYFQDHQGVLDSNRIIIPYCSHCQTGNFAFTCCTNYTEAAETFHVLPLKHLNMFIIFTFSLSLMRTAHISDQKPILCSSYLVLQGFKTKSVDM